MTTGLASLGLAFTLAATLAGCSSNDDDNNIVETDTAGTAGNPTDGQNGGPGGGPGQGSNTRSPQGINENASDRRENAKGREGRGNYNPIMLGDREVRSFDGTSNNEENPEWGATFEHLQRLGNNAYGDGISSLAGQDRVSARVVSNLVSHQGETESIPNTFGTSDWLWQWGQFLDHDLSITDGSTDEAINISVPAGDIYFDPDNTGIVEITANRAIFDPDSGTDVSNPREQENEITSWIDGSMVYGSDEERALALRVGEDSPFLATSSGNLLPFNTAELTNAAAAIDDPTLLFLAGDVRVNEQIGLAAIHTLFVREHNRIAEILVQRSPDASGEEIYQAARRLVIAKIQAITYNEYLPALLGPNTMPAYAGYDASINPNMYNEFTVAAYRLGHSELSPEFLRIDANGNVIAEGNLALRDAYFQAHELFLEETDIDPILRGLANQLHQAIDVQIISDVRNFLFGNPGEGGFDLVALNIQRGRDHGVGSYNDTREAMGLQRVSVFADITADTELLAALESAYNSVDEIDLWIGGLAETPLAGQGSQLGELFTAIVVRQFDEVRAADRFWYQRDLTEDELNILGDTTLSEVIRNNTGIDAELQDNVFFVN